MNQTAIGVKGNSEGTSLYLSHKALIDLCAARLCYSDRLCCGSGSVFLQVLGTGSEIFIQVGIRKKCKFGSCSPKYIGISFSKSVFGYYKALVAGQLKKSLFCGFPNGNTKRYLFKKIRQI